MTRAKVIGAGSIGNHLTQAARRRGWAVTVTDVQRAALDRMRNEIYPGRYGAWDDEVMLATVDQVQRGGFDVIFVGTPPDAHIPVAMEALEERPRVLVIEKPLCPPDLVGVADLWVNANEAGISLLVGFDHAIGQATRRVEGLLADDAIGPIRTIDVEFREHWAGIFAAHPWLDGPADSYLGFWRRGGGASGEHSHAMHLWQHFSHACGHGRVQEVVSALSYVAENGADYDQMMWTALRTESGLLGTVVQDVITRPPRKRARLQGESGAIEWIYGGDPTGDLVRLQRPGRDPEELRIQRSRPDDFVEEILVVEAALKGTPSPALSFERGVDTMLALAAAHQSQRQGRSVKIREIQQDLDVRLTDEVQG